MKKMICMLLICMLGLGFVPLQAKAETPLQETEAPFTDVNGHVYYEVIQFMKEEGIVNGYPDGTFRPDQIITLGEFIKFFSLTVDVPVFQEESEGRWTDYYQTNMILFGVLPEDQNLDMSHPMTYGDMKVLVHNLFITLDSVAIEYEFDEELMEYYLELKAYVLNEMDDFQDDYLVTRAESLAFLLTLFVAYF